MTRTVLITGCSPGGIGHAIARQFLSQGYQVIATARSISALNGLKDLGAIPLELEVTSETSIQACLTKVQGICPTGLDFLVNNAGVNCTIPALDVELDDARHCFDTNFFAVVRLVQVFTPLLMQAKGTIVMLGSLAGEMPYVFGSIYNASKAALLAYSNTLRVELAPFDVAVITLITGGVKSEFTKKVQRYIPDQSVYVPARDAFEGRKIHSAQVGMDVDDYARSVVRQILPGAGPWPWNWVLKDARRAWIWEGGGSWLVWFISAGWWRHRLFDWYFTRKFKLGALRQEKMKNA